MNSLKAVPDQDPIYGWVIVFAAFILSALSFGGLGSVGVLLKPMIEEFGWSRGETAMGYTMLSLAATVFGIFWGLAADRWAAVG
jgi:OFA family oxalate/formate antiporter-like MFS transporter